MRLVVLILFSLFILTACETTPKYQPTTPSTNITEAIPLNQTNSTNETITILSKDIEVFVPRLKNLTMYVLDIEGDATLFQYRDKAILINSGFEDDSEKVLKKIRDLGIDKLDYIFATNTQPKNIGGMPYLILRTEPSYIVENGIPSTIQSYKQYKELYNETTVVKSDTTFSLGEFFVRVLVVYDDGEGFSTNLDDNSLVIRVSYGNSKFLLMSDCSVDCEERLRDADVSADVLKISDSCSATSLSFLQRVNPDVSIVSTSKLDQDFCPSIVQRFKNLNIPLHLTSIDGDIYVTTDGLDYHIDWKKEEIE